MTPFVLSRITLSFCMASALVGLGITLWYVSFIGPVACCSSPFWFLTARFSVDFVVAPLVAGFSYGRMGAPGRIAFWLSCVWMTVGTWPPYLLPLAALCIFTRLRLQEGNDVASDVVAK